MPLGARAGRASVSDITTISSSSLNRARCGTSTPNYHVRSNRRAGTARLFSAGRRAVPALLVGFVTAASTQAAINPDQVLVVYNSQASGATTIKDSYLAAHPTIPAANVFNLNDATIAGVADISYTDFINKIRNPIRTFLDAAPNPPTATSIISIVLIRGIPHRIQDTDNPTVGDNPNGQVSEFFPPMPPTTLGGDATSASVDSELVLLWQDLEIGEAGGQMDSKSDNVIDNPYHTSSTNIQSFSRSNIKTQKTLLDIGNFHVAWQSTTLPPTSGQLTPGDMYLVSRIDGNSVADAQAIITRAANLRVNRKYTWVILDEDARSDQIDDDDLFTPAVFGAGSDYEDTRNAMTAAGWHVRYDNTSNFIESTEQTRPVIAYASYGENHNVNPPGNGTYIDGFKFPRGAIFNTIESYNGRGFNGLGTLFNQEQIADFIAAGGTFGVGNVWEPFSFSVPDNEFVVVNFLVNGMTWAEAAWTSIPALSWAQIVIGDPLAKVVAVVNQTADFDCDIDVDTDDFNYFKNCRTGPVTGAPTVGCEDANIDLNAYIDHVDFGYFQRCISGANILASPTCYP